MKEHRVLSIVFVLLESIVYCLWEFFSQSLWEEYCEHSGKCCHYTHDEDGSGKPVNLDINFKKWGSEKEKLDYRNNNMNVFRRFWLPQFIKISES